MLRHSYNVLLKKTEAKLLGARIDFERNPTEKNKRVVGEIEQQVAWIKDRIEKGLDPGVMTL